MTRADRVIAFSLKLAAEVAEMAPAGIEFWAPTGKRPMKAGKRRHRGSRSYARPRSFVYARTGPKAEDSMPHRKLDGTLVFTTGELRAWVGSREDVVVAGPMESTPAERRLHAL